MALVQRSFLPRNMLPISMMLISQRRTVTLTAAPERPGTSSGGGGQVNYSTMSLSDQKVDMVDSSLNKQKVNFGSILVDAATALKKPERPDTSSGGGGQVNYSTMSLSDQKVDMVDSSLNKQKVNFGFILVDAATALKKPERPGTSRGGGGQVNYSTMSLIDQKVDMVDSSLNKQKGNFGSILVDAATALKKTDQ